MHQSYKAGRGTRSRGGRGGGDGGRYHQTSELLHFPKHLNFDIRADDWAKDFESRYRAKVEMDDKEGNISCHTSDKSAIQAIQNRIDECKTNDEQKCKIFVEGLERVATFESPSSPPPVSLQIELVSSYSFVYPDTNLIYVPGKAVKPLVYIVNVLTFFVSCFPFLLLLTADIQTSPSEDPETREKSRQGQGA
jgi:hypothetical protein